MILFIFRSMTRSRLTIFKTRYLINPTELDLKGKTAFFWAATAAITTVWAYFRLPEVKVSVTVLSSLVLLSNVSKNKFPGPHVRRIGCALCEEVVGQEIQVRGGTRLRGFRVPDILGLRQRRSALTLSFYEYFFFHLYYLANSNLQQRGVRRRMSWNNGIFNCDTLRFSNDSWCTMAQSHFVLLLQKSTSIECLDKENVLALALSPYDFQWPRLKNTALPSDEQVC